MDYHCLASLGRLYPQNIYNNTTGAWIGVYIDDQVDPPGSTSQRQYEIDCERSRGIAVVLVGMATSEQFKNFYDQWGNEMGTMLEWYPYYNQKCLFSCNPPSESNMAPLGYITQQYYLPPGCSSGANSTEAHDEWLSAWDHAQGYFASGGRITGDLVAQY